MSSFVSISNDGTCTKEIESMDICKWKMNEVCCNESSEYLGDYPYPSCKCENKKQCKYFEKEDGK